MGTLTSVPVGGTVFTTAARTDGDDVLIVARSDLPSVVEPLGPVTLLQPQHVHAAALQRAAPVPASGTIRIDDGVLTGLDGRESVHYRCEDVPFLEDLSRTEPGGLHPIVFSGELVVTAGTGSLAGAGGVLQFHGRYSFTENAGYFTLTGALERTADGGAHP